jgi:glycine/D-amino acid oxidase-like deaminating enzyme
MSIRSRSFLGLSTFDDALVPDDGEVTIDLSGLEFIDAYGLVGLASHVVESALEGREISLITPNDWSAAAYLSRMHLGDLVRAFGVELDWPLPRVKERDRHDSLIELQRFSSTLGSGQLADYLWDRLDGKVDPQLVTQIYEAAAELGNNVVEHAECPVGGYMAAQRYKHGKPDEYLVVAVGDAGIGIQASLSRRYGPLSEAEAIEEALKPFVSGTDDPYRGQGLPDIVDGVTGFGGVVHLRSGAAGRRVTRSRASTEQVSHLKGTIVGARVPCRPGR